jgi:hypothetical protein
MAWNPLPAKTLQLFAGGKSDLDPYAKTLANGSNCACGDNISLTYDRLKNPIQFERGLNHLSPLGGRETVEVGGNQHRYVNKQVIDHINANGVGARIELIAIPAASILKFLAVSIYELDAGLTFKVTSRNGITLPQTGKKLVVPIEGGCNPDIAESSAASSALNALTAPASTSRSEHFVFINGNVLNGNSDVITLEVVAIPTSGVVTVNNYFQIDVGYETTLRIY